MLSVAPAIVELGRSRYCATRTDAAVSTACSPHPPAMPPVLRSVIIGRGPKIISPSGFASHATTSPASVSAVVWATQPAIVTGLEAPSCPKVFTWVGMPCAAASRRTSQAYAEKRNGGTA